MGEARLRTSASVGYNGTMASRRSALASQNEISGNDPLRELFEACRNGDLVRVKKLVTPQNVNARDTAGRKSSPLHFAAGEWLPAAAAPRAGRPWCVLVLSPNLLWPCPAVLLARDSRTQQHCLASREGPQVWCGGEQCSEKVNGLVCCQVLPLLSGLSTQHFAS